MEESDQSLQSALNVLWDEHATALGHVVLAWNTLHEDLAKLFARIVSPTNEDIGLAAWHSLKADLAQRDMLLAVAKAAFGETERAFKEVKFLTDKTKALSQFRNDFIHAPYGVTADFDTRSLRVIPIHFFGNVKAENLKTVDLNKELENSAKMLLELSAHADAIKSLMPNPAPNASWPDRPHISSKAQT